jgi:hypothetical protein
MSDPAIRCYIWPSEPDVAPVEDNAAPAGGGWTKGRLAARFDAPGVFDLGGGAERRVPLPHAAAPRG